MQNPYSSPTRTSVMAIISLITGILGFVQVLPVIGPIAAIITGHMAKSEIKKSNGTVTGGGMATAGLILGYLMLVLGLCLTCVLVAAIAGLITLPFAIPFVDTGSFQF